MAPSRAAMSRVCRFEETAAAASWGLVADPRLRPDRMGIRGLASCACHEACPPKGSSYREEGAAVPMPGLAGPRRVFTWQDRQTVQALGLSQSISCETSLCLSHRRLQRGCLDQLSRQHHQQLGKQHRQQLSRQHCQHPQVLLPQERVLSQHL